MADTQSREYPVTGVEFEKASFSFDKSSGKLSGVKEKTSNNTFKPVNPTSDDFTKVIETDEARDAYNIANAKGNKDNYLKPNQSIQKLPQEQLLQKYNTDLKAFNNASSVATIDNYRSGRNLAEDSVINGKGTYSVQRHQPGYSTVETGRRRIFAYPLDINPDQDHMKITRYKYLRSDANASKPRRKEKKNFKKIEVAGDKLIGSDPMGSILLPMPKATDVNSVEWGKSELNASGLVALGGATAADRLGSIDRFFPSASQITRAQTIEQREAKKAQGRGDMTSGGFRGVGQAAMNQFNVTIASLLTGQELDQDTYLARSGGHVLNPNAEMLFQGPTIRNFSFTFLMVARSRKEGEEIRNLIRFLKIGMAPRFNNTTFLKTPDIFTLEYMRGKEHLPTVNRFSPGGLALNSLAVDYAPSGYWAAYRDSQPVALKLDMVFSELRPIYEGDQSDPELEGTVGY